MSEKLPQGWALAKLEDIISEGPRNGYSPKGGADALGSATLKLSATTQGEMILDDSTTKRVYETVDPESQFWLEPGDLLIQRANSLTYLGAAAIYDGKSHAYIYPDLMMRVRTSDSDLLQYLWRYLNTDRCRRYFQANATGTAGNMPKINSKTVKATPVPLPPLNEQRRIVAKIEELTARSRTAKQALDAIPPLLERFRQSVLAAAFRGDLTKQWRQQNPNTEPASELLKRIRQERRHRWEQDYLQTQKAKGKQPKSDKWKGKYKEPEPIDTSNLPELPEGWCWAGILELALLGSGQTPKGIHDNFEANGKVRWFSVGDMNHPNNVREMTTTENRLNEAVANSHSLRLFPTGTIVFPKRGGAIITNKKRLLAFPAALDLNVMGLTSVSCVQRYVWLWFQGLDLGTLAGGSTVPQINNKDIEPLCLPLPPIAEQLEIAALLETALASVKNTTSNVQVQETSLQKLNQSILAKAFRGELVPQDPNDEPASTLLTRIQNSAKDQVTI